MRRGFVTVETLKNPERISHYIKNAKHRLHMTDEDLAEILHTSQQNVSKKLNRSLSFKFEDLVILFNSLGATADDLAELFLLDK